MSPKAKDYDKLVNWDKRLTREAPFFREIFAEVAAGSDTAKSEPVGENTSLDILDIGSGSGRHAIMFAQWGNRVVGVDPDEGMQEQAADNAERLKDTITSGRLRLIDGGFGDLVSLGFENSADVIICTGNALPHIVNQDALPGVMADYFAALRPGGKLVLHLLNHARILEGNERMIPPVLREDGDEADMFLRLVTPSADKKSIGFEFLTLSRTQPCDWNVQARCSDHTALPASLLKECLTQAGFVVEGIYGDHNRKPLEELIDESVIIVAQKRTHD